MRRKILKTNSDEGGGDTSFPSKERGVRIPLILGRKKGGTKATSLSWSWGGGEGGEPTSLWGFLKEKGRRRSPPIP